MPSAESCQAMFTAEYNQGHWTSVGSSDPTQQQRAESAFAKNEQGQPVRIQEEDDGDTKPIHKLGAVNAPPETDFLEFDDVDDTDAPWDN